MKNGHAIFKKVNNSSVVDDIIDQLVASIISGSLKPGDKIPTEAILMEQMHVGRNSVREAIKVLVSYGILEIRRADGTFVCSEFSPKMLNPLLYGLILENNVGELNELREILDCGGLQLAIQNAEADDLVRLKKVISDMQEEIQKKEPDINSFFEMDMEFHKRLAEATHNVLFVKFNEVLSLLLTRVRLKNIGIYIEKGYGQYIVDLHIRSYQVIENRNGDSILQIVRDTLEPANEVIYTHHVEETKINTISKKNRLKVHIKEK